MKYIITTLFFLWIVNPAKCQVELINAGIGGNNTVQLLQRIEKDVISLRPDLCILMVGTNDRLNSRKMMSYADYSKNLNLIVKKLKATGMEVLLMSPPPVDSAYLLSRHDRSLFSQAPNEIMDSVSHIVSEIALRNETLFLNLYDKFSDLGLPNHNEDIFIRNPKNSGAKDGVHPTSFGYHFIAENIYQFLKKNNLLDKYSKIICFGDSITRGSGSKNSGTLGGENYPSYLYQRLLALKK